MAVMGKTYIGTKAGSATTSLEFDPVTKVVLYVSDGVAFTAGVDGGQVIEADCPYATQAMANSILNKLKGQKYRPITGTDTIIDPAAELGDGLTMASTYSVLASRDDTCDELYTADVGAPGKREPESEIGAYKGALSRKMSRNAAELRSSITKTAEEIRLEVQNTKEGLESSISQKADEIRAEITGPQGSLTILANLVDGFTVTDPDGTTKIKGGSIQTNSITADQIAANAITADELAAGAVTADHIQAGSITSDQIKTGSIKFSDFNDEFRQRVTGIEGDVSDAKTAASSAQDDANTANNALKNWGYQGSTTYIDGGKIESSTIKAGKLIGGTVQLLDYWERNVGSISITDTTTGYGLSFNTSSGGIKINPAGNFWVDAAGGSFGVTSAGLNCNLDVVPNADGGHDLGSSGNRWGSLYLKDQPWGESDENMKNTIEPIDGRYLTLLDRIQPVRFKKVNGSSGRYHTGFIAQDVEKAMLDSGLTDTDLAAWGIGDGGQMLRYTEFIAILLAKVQQLEGRLAEVEHGYQRTD